MKYIDSNIIERGNEIKSTINTIEDEMMNIATTLISAFIVKHQIDYSAGMGGFSLLLIKHNKKEYFWVEDWTKDKLIINAEAHQHDMVTDSEDKYYHEEMMNYYLKLIKLYNEWKEITDFLSDLGNTIGNEYLLADVGDLYYKEINR